MAQIHKADGIIDWLDQRLAVKPLMKVLMTEYWIPKNINFLWAMGVVLVVLFSLLVVSGLFLLMYYFIGIFNSNVFAYFFQWL